MHLAKVIVITSSNWLPFIRLLFLNSLLSIRLNYSSFLFSIKTKWLMPLPENLLKSFSRIGIFTMYNLKALCSSPTHQLNKQSHLFFFWIFGGSRWKDGIKMIELGLKLSAIIVSFRSLLNLRGLFGYEHKWRGFDNL
jgi:hypothetical protein